MTKRLTVFLTFIIVVLVASNLYLALKPPEVVHVVEYVTPPKYPIVIEDFIGREITIYKPPTRIVSCAPSITEIVSALNLTSQIVGLDDFSDFPPIILELKSQGKIASVGGVTTLNIEKIAQLNPDLVLVYAGLQRKFIPLLEELNLTVVALDAKTISEVYDSILLIGKITDRVEIAEEIIAKMRRKIESIQIMLSQVPIKTRVFFINWLEPVWTTGNNTFLNDIIRLAGGYNIFIDANGWVTVSPEAIVDRNPEVIIIGCTMIGLSAEEVKQKLRAIPGLENTEALKKDKVYLLFNQAENIFLRPSPRVVEAIELLTKILYPDLFDTKIPTIIGDDYSNYVERIMSG